MRWLLLLLLLLPIASAQEEDPCAEASSFDVECALKGVINDMGGGLFSVNQKMAGVIFGAEGEPGLIHTQLYFDMMRSVDLVFMQIIFVVYAMWSLFIAVSLAWARGNAKKMSKVRYQLEWFFFTGALILLSPIIYSVILLLSTGISFMIINTVDITSFLQVGLLDVFTGSFFMVQGIGSLTLLLTALVILMTKVILGFGLPFFTIGTLCYGIPQVRNLGKMIFAILLYCVLTPLVIWLVVLPMALTTKLTPLAPFSNMLMAGSFGIAVIVWYFGLKAVIRVANKEHYDNGLVVAFDSLREDISNMSDNIVSATKTAGKVAVL